MVDAVKLANELGFDVVTPVASDMITCSRELRAMCSPRYCPTYGNCWSCPPGAGTFEECEARIASTAQGVIVQTVREGLDYWEIEEVDELRTLHNSRLDQLADAIREQRGDAFEFTTGGCNLCESCTYPDAPCSKPDIQRLALSAHGIGVAAMCSQAGAEYEFVQDTTRFVGLVLY